MNIIKEMKNNYTPRADITELFFQINQNIINPFVDETDDKIINNVKEHSSNIIEPMRANIYLNQNISTISDKELFQKSMS